MSVHEPMPIPSGAADAVLDALPHPVIMVTADGRIANANAAAESFFRDALARGRPASPRAPWSWPRGRPTPADAVGEAAPPRPSGPPR